MKSQAQRDSQRQEKELAMDLGGRVQKASGALAYAKGDVRVLGKTRVRAEAKGTVHDWYALSYKTIEKIRKEALNGGDDLWVLQLRFQRTPSQFAICDYNWFYEIYFSMPEVRKLKINAIYTRKNAQRIHQHGLLRFAAEAYSDQCVPCFNINYQQGGVTKLVAAVIPWDVYLKVYGFYDDTNCQTSHNQAVV